MTSGILRRDIHQLLRKGENGLSMSKAIGSSGYFKGLLKAVSKVAMEHIWEVVHSRAAEGRRGTVTQLDRMM